MSYDQYPEYPQLFPPFEHSVSILDLLFNTGPEAHTFIDPFPLSCRVLTDNNGEENSA